MRKKMLIWHFLYYVLASLSYIAFLYLSSLLLDLSGNANNLGDIIAATYGIFFIGTPIMITVIMRFSLLKWYVDPFAAAEIPLFLYLGMVINRMKRTNDLSSAFLLVNKSLCEGRVTGWVFLIGLFVFGLVASFSFSRKEGQSISYRLISKISPR